MNSLRTMQTLIEQNSTLSDHSAFSALGIEQPLTEEDLRNMKIAVLSCSDEELVFDIVGVDVALVNALRRILIAEVCYLFYLFTINFDCFSHMNSVFLLI